MPLTDLPPNLSPSTKEVRGYVAQTETVSQIPTATAGDYFLVTRQVWEYEVVPVLEAASAEALELEQQFGTLTERWYEDTVFSSSYFEKILHPSYQKILTLGKGAIPLILKELEDMPNDWFWALRFLSNDADPVSPEQAGDMQAMTDAWLQWGKDEGYI